MSFTDFLFFGGYDGAISLCLDRISKGKQTKIFTPNAEMICVASKEDKIMKLLSGADIALPDGIGVYLGTKMLNIYPYERTNGIDLAERLLKIAEDNRLKVFLLGAKDGVAERAASGLTERFPKLLISGTHHGYFDKKGEENERITDEINRSRADILFVCLGFPEQEKWIDENLSRLKNVKVAMGLGGSIDVWSGDVARAPVIFRKIGLEWLWRLALSPQRIARLPSLFRFATLCVRQKAKIHIKSVRNLLQNR